MHYFEHQKESSFLDDLVVPRRWRRLQQFDGPVVKTTQELFVLEMVYQTLIDCYKIATGAWKHFRFMRWHGQDDSERILQTAHRKTEEWILSDEFRGCLKICGEDSFEAQSHTIDLLNGKHNGADLKELIYQIGKNRDARKARE